MQAVADQRARSREGDPNHCAIASYHGSSERPDNGFAGDSCLRLVSTASTGSATMVG